MVDRLKDGDADAARQLWDLFSVRLLAVARSHLPDKNMSLGDEEDVVLSALATFFTGAGRGKFTEVSDRAHLWKLLALMTKRKVFNLVTREDRQKRGPNESDVSLISIAPEDEEGFCTNPMFSPDFQAATNEACQRLLDILGDVQLRSIAVWKLEGYSDAEIAGMLGCAVRSVHRKLHLIRRIWCQSEDR